MSQLEIESKYELTAADFERLLTLGQVSSCADQLNVYYDAEWKLADSASTLRIRFGASIDPVLTLKVPVAQNGSRRVMREFEIRLARDNATSTGSHHPAAIHVERDLPSELRYYLVQLGVNKLVRMGWVRNSRTVLEVSGIGSLELDRLELPNGTTYYEVEIESNTDRVHESLVQWVRTYAPDAKPSLVSKFQRFRAAVTESASRHLLHESR
jgi:uncharacterized protein YjbK